MWYQWVSFPLPYSSPPSVTVVHQRNRGDLAPCTGYASDANFAYAGGITTNGFYAYGGFSPPGSSACGGAYDGWVGPVHVAWIAAGSP